MSYGILLLRLTLGLTMAGHGSRDLLGSFGGSGLRVTGEAFGRLGFRAPLLAALAAGLAELAGGALLATGFLVPLAALAIGVVMLNAIVAVHWRYGFWNLEQGYEYPLLLGATAAALAALGGGSFSVDRLLGWDDNISGLWWGIGVLALTVLLSAFTLTLRRRRSTLGERAAAAHTRTARPAA
jgi:putative oxidoreductase